MHEQCPLDVGEEDHVSTYGLDEHQHVEQTYRGWINQNNKRQRPMEKYVHGVANPSGGARVFAARGKRLYRRPPRAVLGFCDGGGGGEALGAIPPLPCTVGSGAEPRPKSNLVHFYPQNIPSKESKLSDFCGI